MNDPDPATLDYVRSAAALAGLQLDPARARAVALHLSRSAAIARALDAVALTPADEPAEIFRPAPFPAPGQEPG
jgi:hypothetical protein